MSNTPPLSRNNNNNTASSSEKNSRVQSPPSSPTTPRAGNSEQVAYAPEEQKALVGRLIAVLQTRGEKAPTEAVIALLEQVDPMFAFECINLPNSARLAILLPLLCDSESTQNIQSLYATSKYWMFLILGAILTDTDCPGAMKAIENRMSDIKREKEIKHFIAALSRFNSDSCRNLSEKCILIIAQWAFMPKHNNVHGLAQQLLVRCLRVENKHIYSVFTEFLGITGVLAINNSPLNPSGYSEIRKISSFFRFLHQNPDITWHNFPVKFFDWLILLTVPPTNLGGLNALMGRMTSSKQTDESNEIRRQILADCIQLYPETHLLIAKTAAITVMLEGFDTKGFTNIADILNNVMLSDKEGLASSLALQSVLYLYPNFISVMIEYLKRYEQSLCGNAILAVRRMIQAKELYFSPEHMEQLESAGNEVLRHLGSVDNQVKELSLQCVVDMMGFGRGDNVGSLIPYNSFRSRILPVVLGLLDKGCNGGILTSCIAILDAGLQNKYLHQLDDFMIPLTNFMLRNTVGDKLAEGVMRRVYINKLKRDPQLRSQVLAYITNALNSEFHSDRVGALRLMKVLIKQKLLSEKDIIAVTAAAFRVFGPNEIFSKSPLLKVAALKVLYNVMRKVKFNPKIHDIKQLNKIFKFCLGSRKHKHRLVAEAAKYFCEIYVNHIPAEYRQGD